MDIAVWLRGLGLEQYEAAFRANAVDASVLPRLTAEDLKDLGVTLVGHRRRLLDAIAALGAEPAVADVPVRVAAERRQLSVMFCDLVGSTALAVRFDPEDLREIEGAYHRVVAETVGCYGGFVAKNMGDGVLVYFGYPEAHEDDAERAVRAGLAVIDAVGRLATPEPLNVRLGIASGLVVVGDLIGAGAAQERGVVGETPNLAARLQAVAQPGTLVIAESTRRQIGALFECADLGAQRLAGFAQAQHVWRVVDESGVVSRFEALRSEATPLVGRDEEPWCCGAGNRRKPARGAWCLFPGSRGSANRVWLPPCRRAFKSRDIRACAIFARRTIRTAPSTRLSPRSNTPLASPVTTRPKRSSAN